MRPRHHVVHGKVVLRGEVVLLECSWHHFFVVFQKYAVQALIVGGSSQGGKACSHMGLSAIVSLTAADQIPVGAWLLIEGVADSGVDV